MIISFSFLAKLFGKLHDFRGSGKRSGQVIVFEQVMLFAVGVIIFIVAFAAFSLYRGYFVDVGLDNQLEQINTMVATKILLMAEGGNSSIEMKIPTSLNGELYTINISRDDESYKWLNVSTPFRDKWRVTKLYGITETHSVSGLVPSVRGRILIIKEGSNIFIQ